MGRQPQRRPAPPPPQGGAAGIPVAGDEGRIFEIKNWGSIDTQADRTAIADEDFSWLENLMPVGDGNLKAIYSNSSPIYTASVGRTIVWFFPYNIGATSYTAVFLDDGTAIQVNLASGATTTISATVGTFYTAGGDLPGATQVGSSGIIIVTTAVSNGYYAWDGSTFYKAGDFAPGWLSGLTLPLSFTGNTHTSTTVDTLVPNTTNVVDGMGITGTDIPAGTTISGHALTTFTLSQAATGSTVGGTFSVAYIMPTGVQGTAVEVYQSRIWIDDGTVKLFSAPSNGARFDSTLGGGSIKATDSFLRRDFIISKQLSSFLYSFGDSSINVISNVQTSGSPVSTTFNNQNVDAQIGTTWAGTVHPFGRGMMFANPSGVYALYGGAAEKVSAQLDGIFANADFTTVIPSGGSVTLNGVHIFFLLIRSKDYLGNVRPFLCVWDGKKWFIASQAKTNISYVDSQEINSVFRAYGTDGSSLFQMFTTPSAAINKVIQTKYWQGDTYLINKQALRAFSLGTDLSGLGYSFTGTLDMITESSGQITSPVTLTVSPQAVQFQNNLSQNVNFINNASAAVTFTVFGSVGLLGQNVDAIGALIGMTIVSSSTDFTLAALSVIYRRLSPVGG